MMVFVGVGTNVTSIRRPQVASTREAGMNWSLIAEVLKAAGGAVALLGIPITYLAYNRSVQTKRAEWLASLHEKFFETDRYARIRRVLDYAEEPVYGQLAAAVSNGVYHSLADELWRYLNFFEFLAGLRQLGQISDKEIVRLFDYDLRLIRRQEFIMNALDPEGFDGLAILLRTVRFDVALR